MRRTYKSKKETDGTIDPRDVLHTLDAKSSLFDAFYIQNIKQTKRDISVACTTQFAASNKVRKRKYVRRLKEQEALFHPRESTSETAFLTPDKSFRVNKAPDLFDQLLNSSCNDVETRKPVKFLKKQNSIQKKTYIKKKQKRNNITSYNSDSSDSDKENFNSREEVNKTPNTSDIKNHKLVIERETKSSLKYIDESINNIVNNLSIFTHIKDQSVATPNNENYNITKQAQLLQTSPLCSTPFLNKYRGGSIYRFSPISINQDHSPKYVNVMENSMDFCTDNPNITHKEKNMVNDYKIDKKQNIKDATIKENMKQSIAPKEKYEYDNTFEIVNETNTSASVTYDTIDETDKTEDQSPILSKQTVNSNKREPRKLETYLSFMQTTEMEPFHGFKDIDLVENDKLDAVTNKLMDMDNILVDNSYKLLSPTKISGDSTFVNTNLNTVNDKNEIAEINTSSAAESSESDLFYDTCNSNDSIEEEVQKNEPIYNNIKVQVPNVEPLVIVERLNDSVFDKYYSQMANYSVKSYDDDINTSSDYSEYGSVSDDVSIKSSNYSVVSENSAKDDGFNISIADDENNKSIDSFKIDYNDNSIESKAEDVCVSFVTTRRRNEICNGSFIGLDNSSVSANSREFDKTVLTNKNSLEYTNYVTEEEDNIDNIDETINIENEAIDKNGTDCKCSTSESDDICQVDLPPKEKNMLTRKSARESINSNNKSKSPIHKLPKIEDNADGLFKIENKEMDQHGSEYRCSISESDKIKETKLTPKVKKKVMRKSARKTSEAFSFKSSIKNGYKSLNIVTRKSSKMCTDSFVREHPNSSEYEDNIGNNSTSCEQPGIILQPGKRWERSLSIYRRMTTMVDQFDHSIMDEEQNKVRKYRQSFITTSEIHDLEDSFHNDSITNRRSTFVSKPSRSTIKIVRNLAKDETRKLSARELHSGARTDFGQGDFFYESNSSRASICSTIVCEDLEGFLGEDCDDTIVELSKLSIDDSQHEVTIIEKFHDTSNRRTTARDYVLRRCNQADVLPFDECYPDPVLKNCRKIGEGVYGEVFLWRAGDGRARVLKVIPIAGNIKVNGEQQKDFHEVISEIVIAMELSALRAPIADIEQHLNEGKSLETLDLHSVENATDAFNEVLRVRCVSGSYPSRLLELWELYDECRGSENDNPAALPPHQQYIVLELGNAGEDLESYQFNNAEQSYALFKQIAFGLAVAEEAYQFEHRDLHWGNVLISPTDEKYASFVVRGRLHRVRRAGVRVSVIDYSLSRATLGRCALYNDLAHDDALFDALGDYQFQLYRLMRDKLGNDWKNFEPYTNVLWLHYTVDKMITALRYTRTNTKIHKHYIAKLKEIKNRILDYGSAVQYVLTDNEF